MVAKLWNGLHTVVGRGLAGLSALATLTWFLWPEANWHIHGDALASLVISVTAWIASLSPVPIKKASEHDIQLLRRFRDLFSEGEKDFLREHDFGNSFSLNRLSGTRELADRWHGAEYEFDDVQIQEKLDPIVRDCQELLHRMTEYTDVINPHNMWTSIVPHAERAAENFSRQTLDRIRDYNDRATKIVTEIDAFIKFARPRLESVGGS